MKPKTCPKCGSDCIGSPRYMPREDREELWFLCSCGYTIKTPTLDAQTKPKLKAKKVRP